MKIQPEQRDFSELDFKEIHDIVFPADIRQTDLVTARVRKHSTDDDFQTMRVWKMSPLGIELLPGEPTQFSAGDELDLSLIVGKQTTYFEGLIVALAPLNNDRRILGIRLAKKQEERTSTKSSRRRGSRWICSSQFDPVCMAANPLQFNDFLYFKIRDISKTGLRVVTSLRNKFIVPGMELETQVSFPMTSQVSMTLKVARISLTAEHGKDFLEVGLEFMDISSHQRQVIGQYLVQFSDAESLRAIRQEDFFPTSLTKGVDYQYIKTAQEFKEVLELRHLANRSNKKVAGDTDSTDMADIYDTRSRIIVGRYRGRIVGTARMAFNELGDKMEHEEFVELPLDFPRSEQILECARAATHPDFRGSDLWNTLIQHVAIAAIQANRPWVLLSTTAELCEMYLRIGFTDTKLRYHHPLYPEQEQFVLYVNVAEVVVGRGIGPIYWNVIYKDVAQYLAQANKGNTTPLSSMRTKIYLLLNPFAQLLRYFSTRPRKSKKNTSS